MPHYITLINWTDQGAKSVKDTGKRAEAARNQATKMGGKIQLFYTLGQYDIVGVGEFPDDETFQKFLFTVASLGYVRTTSMKAWSEEEVSRIVASLP